MAIRAHRGLLPVLLSGLLILVSAPAGAYPRPGRTEMVSTTAEGSATHGSDGVGGSNVVITPDGRHVAFASDAPDLVPGDRDDDCRNYYGDPVSCKDVFVKDRRTGAVSLISLATDGTRANGNSSFPSISANGRFIAFDSFASNLVPGDTNVTTDVFVRDRDADEDGVLDEPGAVATERVSVSSAGGQATKYPSQHPSISADGMSVVFSSGADGLVANDKAFMDVFVHDRGTRATNLVTVDSDGTQAPLYSENPSGGVTISRAVGSPAISADGRFVAFESNVDLKARNGDYRQFGTGEPCQAGSFGCLLQPTVRQDVWIHDRDADRDGRFDEPGAIQTASVTRGRDGNRVPANPSSYGGSLSADGRYVTYKSSAGNLVPADGNGTVDVFVLDRDVDADGEYDEPGAVRTVRASVSSAGVEASAWSQSAALSPEGRFVSFASQASNLAPNDSNANLDVFVHDLVTGITERVSVSTDGSEANGQSPNVGDGEVFATPSVTAGGREVAFTSLATNLSQDQEPREERYVEAFVRVRGDAVGVTELDVSTDANAVTVGGRAAFAGVEIAEATDPGADGLSGAREAGAEITGAELVYRPEQEDVLLRLDVAKLTGNEWFVLNPNGGFGSYKPGAPGTVYGFAFTAGQSRYQVRARAPVAHDVPVITGATPITLRTLIFELYLCEDLCRSVATLSGGYGTASESVSVAVPLSAFGGQSGMTLTDLSAFTSVADPASERDWDRLTLPSTVLPQRAVAIAIEPAGTPKSEARFTAAQLSSGSGAFVAVLERSSVPSGRYDVWARACAGGTCSFADVTVEI